MAKQKPVFTMTTYGIYDKWDAKAKSLPKIIDFTTEVEAQEDVEFGFTLNVKKGKGLKLVFTIFHPDIPDDKGDVMPPFDGVVYVENNNWDFYLGDCIWLPLENKVGDWRMVITLDDNVVAEKTFNVSLEPSSSEGLFWKKRGF